MGIYAEYVFDVINRNWKTGLDYGKSMCPEVTEMLTDLMKTKKWYWGETWGVCLLTRKEGLRFRTKRYPYIRLSRKACLIIYKYGSKYPMKFGSTNLANGGFHYHTAPFTCFDKINCLLRIFNFLNKFLQLSKRNDYIWLRHLLLIYNDYTILKDTIFFFTF